MGEYQDNSLGSRVFQRLREDILSGKYKEHDELRENTLGKELGVSRTPVREALRQLELEGLVTIIPNKGAYVTGISSKDIRDIYIPVSYTHLRCYCNLCSIIRRSLVVHDASSEKGAEENPGDAGFYGSWRYCIDNKRILRCDH